MLDTLNAELMSPASRASQHSQDAIVLKQAITLNYAQYHYPNAPYPALKSLTINRPAISTAGLVGAPCNGKAITVDLIFSLLKIR